MLILAQLYKYFNKDDEKKEGFVEGLANAVPPNSGTGAGADLNALPRGIMKRMMPPGVNSTTISTKIQQMDTNLQQQENMQNNNMQVRENMRGPITQTPTAAMQVSSAKQSTDITEPPQPLLVPLKTDNKFAEAMQDMKSDAQQNPLTEEVRLKFAELEKLGKEAKKILKF